MKGNVIQMNTLHLNSVRLNGIGKVQSVSLKGGSTEDPVFPPVEPPVEPEPTPTYTLSASVTNGKVSAKRNGSAVNLPYTANEGDVIIVEVTPNDGYSFEGWADGNTDNPRSITMTADVALSAQCVEVVQPPVGKYIQFEDKNVEAICVANWSSDGIGLTEEDAAAVTDIGNKFNSNTEITSFEELRYFTGLTYISGGALASSAFRNCVNLKKIVIPRNVTNVKDFAMDGCSSLEDVIFEDADKITTIGTYAFRSTKATGELSFPNLETIYEGAFVATKVKKLVNLGKITSLKGGGLYTGIINNNSEVEFVDIPQSVTSIDAYYFARCYNLATIICRPTTPPSLGANFLYNVSWQTQTTIYVPDASLEAYKTAVNWSAYADRIHPLSEIEGSPYIQFEDAEAERVLMANGVSSDGIGITKEDAAAVTTIGNWFKGNTAMTSFEELQYFTGVTTLDNYTFAGCTALEAVNLDNITIAKNSSLRDTAIKKVIMPSIVTIGDSIFTLNYGITTMLFGKEMASISQYAFWQMTGNQTTLVCLATTPPTLAGNNNLGVFVAIYVPDSSVADYKSAERWSSASAKFKPLSQLATDNPTLYAEIQQYL